jgi:hypothetical protein
MAILNLSKSEGTKENMSGTNFCNGIADVGQRDIM